MKSVKKNEEKETTLKNEKFTKEYVLWHGSIEGIKFPIKVNYSNNLCDFGKGFYLGEMREQAENRVCNSKKAVLYQIRLKVDKKCKVYKFEDEKLWAIFVAYNRQKISFKKYPKLLKKIKLIEKSDIIIGKIADDKLAFAYNNFIDGLTTDKVLMESLKLVQYGNQVVIKKQKYLKGKYFTIEKIIVLTTSEKKKSLMWGKKLKRNMEQDLEDIQAKYMKKGDNITTVLERYENGKNINI